MNAQPTKLRNGTWGITTQGQAAHDMVCTVTTRAGKTWTATVDRVIWTGKNREGKIVSICSTVAREHRHCADTYGYSRRECITGGNCSSMGSGRGCGAEDCDGY